MEHFTLKWEIMHSIGAQEKNPRVGLKPTISSQPTHYQSHLLHVQLVDPLTTLPSLQCVLLMPAAFTQLISTQPQLKYHHPLFTHYSPLMILQYPFITLCAVFTVAIYTVHCCEDDKFSVTVFFTTSLNAAQRCKIWMTVAYDQSDSPTNTSPSLPGLFSNSQQYRKISVLQCDLLSWNSCTQLVKIRCVSFKLPKICPSSHLQRDVGRVISLVFLFCFAQP